MHINDNNSEFSNNRNIFKKSQLYEEEKIFYDLGPKDNVDEKNIYYNKFMTAIKKKCKMIAITGAYGVGKTSVINAILKKINYKEIRISLGSYDFNETQNNYELLTKLNTKNNSYNDLNKCVHNNECKIDLNDVETKIVQQIIYTTDEKKLPYSKFKRIKYINIKEKIKIGSIIIISTILMHIVFPITFKKIYVEPYNRMYTNISAIINDKFLGENDFMISSLINISKGLCFIPLLLLFWGNFYFLYKVIIIIKGKFNIAVFKYKNLELKVEQNDDCSVFNKYLDEIVYFFKETKHNIIVIEDLDRYGNISLEIFRKLKELNFLLNSNGIIKKNGGVIFIYALRDDLFLNCEDRVKFFDCVIPVVSNFSKQNAKQYIYGLYEQFKKEYKFDIDDKLLRVISLYIQDRRLLLNIFMEFKVYIDNLKDNQANNYTELFALICYKNLNPADFEKRLYLDGDLYNLYNNKMELINILNERLQEVNIKIMNENKIIENGKKIDVMILKKAFILNALQNVYINSNLENIIINIDNSEFTINEFINKDIDFKIVPNTVITIGSKNYTKNNVVENIQEELINKLSLLKYDLDKNNMQIQKNLEEINNMNTKTIEEVLNIDGIREISINWRFNEIFNNSLLISLAKNGFIKESFEKSISFFKSGELSVHDYKFLICVDTNNKMEYNYKLIEIERIVKMIEVKDFLNEVTLNFDIVTFLLSNSQKYELKFMKLKEQFEMFNMYKFEFLNMYLENKTNDFRILLNSIIDDGILVFLIENIHKNPSVEKMMKFIIENILIDTKDLSKRIFEIELANNFKLLNSVILNITAKKNLIHLQLNILNYELLEFDKVELFYMNSTYNVNKSFYKKLLDYYKLEDIYYNEKFLDIIYANDKFTGFKNKMVKINEFNKLYCSFVKFNSNEINIIKALNDESIDINDKKIIISNETNKIIDINQISDNELVKLIIEKSLYSFTMNNIFNYYTRVKLIDDTILNMIEEIGNDYVYLKDEGFEQFEKELIYSQIKENIKYEKIAKEFIYNICSFKEDTLVNEKLLTELIKNNKVHLNMDTYTKLEKLNKNQLIELVKNKIDDLIKIESDILISNEIIQEIINSQNNINQKLHFINSSTIQQLSKISISDIIKDVIINNSNLQENIAEILFYKVDEQDKIEFFIYLHSKNNENIKYLSKINEKTAKIRDGITTTQSFDKKYMKLLKYLKNINFINKLEIKPNSIKISYNKSKFIL